MGWAQAITGGLGVASSLFGASQQRNASDAARRASEQANQETRQARDQAIGFQQPYMGIGQTGLSGLQGIANGQYQQAFDSPFFKARVDFANQRFNDKAGAQFRLFSGGAQNDRDELNQNLAAEGIRDYTNFNMGLAGMGQQSANAAGQIGMGAAQQIGRGLAGIADAAQQRAGANAGLGYSLANIGGQYLPGMFGSSYSSGGGGSGGGGSNSFGMPTYNSGNNPFYSGNWT